MTSSDKIKTPIMELHFKNSELTKAEALKYSKQLEKVKLRALVKHVAVEEWKDLYREGGKLLDYHERKRYYRITLEYEKEEYMLKEYNISYTNIQEKIQNILVVQLLNFINRVKKRNELKAEIKRTHVEKEVPEEDDDEVEKEKDSNPEKENAEEQKPALEKMEEEVAEKEKVISYNSNEFEKVTFGANSCEITIKVSLNLKKFLMTKVIEKLLGTTIMKEIQGINSVVVLEKKGIQYMQTEGVNFDILSKFNFLEWRNVRSNDIQAIAKRFGVIILLFRSKQPETC
jgi:hypothetical protein